MDHSLRWIDRTDSFNRELERLRPGPLAVDTEADSMHHFREKVCLIQISAHGVDLLIDPLADVDLGPLGPLLADAGLRKILHGADYDLRMLRRDFDFGIRGLFDTMIAARLTGERAFGLAALLERHLGVTVDKRFQRADWSCRPIPAPMRDYAATDTRHLEELARILSEKLAEQGRTTWAEEEFRRLEGVTPRDGLTPAELVRRMKGIRRLDRRGLAVLAELSALRDEVAREKDRPRFRIVHDDVLVALAAAACNGTPDLTSFPRLPASWRRGGRRRSMEQAVDTALALPESELPEPPPRPGRRRDPVLEARVRDLGRQRDRLAAGLGLEPSVLASRAVLEEVSRRIEEGEEPGNATDLRAWQLDLLAPIFRRSG